MACCQREHMQLCHLELPGRKIVSVTHACSMYRRTSCSNKHWYIHFKSFSCCLCFCHVTIQVPHQVMFWVLISWVVGPGLSSHIPECSLSSTHYAGPHRGIRKHGEASRVFFASQILMSTLCSRYLLCIHLVTHAAASVIPRFVQEPMEEWNHVCSLVCIREHISDPLHGCPSPSALKPCQQISVPRIHRSVWKTCSTSFWIFFLLNSVHSYRQHCGQLLVTAHLNPPYVRYPGI